MWYVYGVVAIFVLVLFGAFGYQVSNPPLAMLVFIGFGAVMFGLDKIAEELESIRIMLSKK